MAKSKYAPALYEVINQKKDSTPTGRLKPPKWWKSGKEMPAKKAEAQTSELTTPEPAVPEPAAKPQTAAPTPKASVPSIPPEDRPAHPTILRVGSGRLEISLNPVNTIVVVGVLLLALFSSYQIGRGVSNIAAPVAAGNLADNSGDEIEQALAQMPNAKVLDVGSKRSARDRTASPGRTSPAGIAPKQSPAAAEIPAGPQPGLNYVILDSYKLDHKPSADYVQRWLERKYGLATMLQKRGKYWQLVCLNGFDYSKPGEKEQCLKFCKDIQSLGDECKKELIKADLVVYKFARPLPKQLIK